MKDDRLDPHPKTTYLPILKFIPRKSRKFHRNINLS